MKLKYCPECKGSGWVKGIRIVPAPNGPEEVPTRDECEVCNGEGQILKEEENK